MPDPSTPPDERALAGYLEGRPRDMPAGARDPNEEAIARYRLVPHLLPGASGIDLTTDVFGFAVAAPLMVGAFAGDRILIEDGGILPIARAAASLGLPLVVSEECLTPLADITAVHPHATLQIRGAGTRARALALVDHAAEAGARGFVVTGLAPVHVRGGFFPGGFDIGAESARRGLKTIAQTVSGEAVEPFPGWSFEDLAAVAGHAAQRGLRVTLKGVLAAADAEKAAAAGCDAVMVSNLGVRNLYRFAPAVDCLPDVAAAAQGRVVMLDGGIRNGADVVVACALGAHLATLVRPVVWAARENGEAGARALLSGFMDDIATITFWLGCENPSQLGPSHVMRL